MERAAGLRLERARSRLHDLAVWVLEGAMRTIAIVRAQSGWMVRSDAIGKPLFFCGGGSADGAALRLAHGLADAGQGARV